MDPNAVFGPVKSGSSCIALRVAAGPKTLTGGLTLKINKFKTRLSLGELVANSCPPICTQTVLFKYAQTKHLDFTMGIRRKW